MEVKQNIGMRVLHAIKHFFKKIGLGIYHKFINFIVRFKEGSTPTKISHIIMGYGNLARKQIYKGLIFLFLQIAFLYVFIASPEVNSTPIGFKALANLITLGTVEGDIFTAADNSMLMLLFGVLTFGLISMFIAAYLSNIKSSVFNDERIAKGLKPRSIREDIHELTDSKFHILMLTPAIIGIITFTVLPTIFMILIAFTNYDSTITAGASLFEWVGFDNFVSVLRGEGEVGTRFIPVLTWTLVWAVIATFSNYFLGILLGTLINKKTVRLKKLWRTVFIMTIAIPQFISLLAMRNLLSEYGPVNNMLQQIGILHDSFAFLSEDAAPMTARATVLFINLWVGIPYTMLMTMGILMNIPADLYEAAIVDGANKRQLFFKITMPYVIFVTTPYLITSFVGNITSFNIIYLLSGGGPSVTGYSAGSTDLLVTWLYKLTIDENEYNMGSVIAIFTFIIIATGTLLTYRRSKAYREEETFQ